MTSRPSFFPASYISIISFSSRDISFASKFFKRDAPYLRNGFIADITAGKQAFEICLMYLLNFLLFISSGSPNISNEELAELAKQIENAYAKNDLITTLNAYNFAFWKRFSLFNIPKNISAIHLALLNSITPWLLSFNMLLKFTTTYLMLRLKETSSILYLHTFALQNKMSYLLVRRFPYIYRVWFSSVYFWVPSLIKIVYVIKIGSCVT